MSLTHITLPSKLDSIKSDAFKFCDALKTITIQTATPPKISDPIFTYTTNTSLTLIVPKGSKAAYDTTWTSTKLGIPNITIVEQ